MAFDLGLEHQSFSNDEEITEFIKDLSKKIDLVLIAEHFDESLVLMKRLLCWDFEDIIYVKHKIRNSAFKNKMTEKQKVIFPHQFSCPRWLFMEYCFLIPFLSYHFTI